MWKHFKFDPHSIHFSCHTDIKLNYFDLLLCSEWDRALSQGLFTFQIDSQLKQRILDGDLRYTIELNPSRYEKRRAPHPFENVNTPFDKNKFNFNKIKDEEILFSLDTEERTDKNLIIINNSPIRPYHVLLVPDRELEQPQILTVDCILFGLQFIVSSAHPYIFLGFNSLCAYASINHLHLHGLYLPDRVYLQTNTQHYSPFDIHSNCYLFDLFHAQAFVFEIKHIGEFNRIARHIYTVTNYFTTSNIAHNLLILKGHSLSLPAEPALRVFIWCRQPIIGAKTFHQCNFACLELSGYMYCQFEEVFDNLTESTVCEALNGIGLSLEEQEKIRKDLKDLLLNDRK